MATKSILPQVEFTKEELESDEEWIVAGTDKEIKEKAAKQARGLLDFSWSFLILTVSGGLRGLGIYFKVELAGFTIASATLSASNPEFNVSANVGVAKAKLRIYADFTKNKVYISGQIQTRKWGIGGWNKPRSFNECIFSW